ncbi:ABC transporter permease [Agrobacterium rubi]|uniref:ABC transporter permease n=2 Tax=Rhizobium/Agrobacterium group TaxID=227290 RepID=A0AAE7UTF2_9HYPH|nr:MULTISPECIES: ABC transporter permease [Agrobacterium]MBN7809221.1 ABC transporter permease [Agrobacterium rosae]NTE89837.1 ABC transporter permease [Agrobacterium rubi]NTF05313.1 ABC transporter permease [Agrobacterium rubi]NTF39757.1 ABC transporter permease [Agrobacterium rubi]OCJ44929.1 ABC transporter permease [Agrobacterium rubi]
MKKKIWLIGQLTPLTVVLTLFFVVPVLLVVVVSFFRYRMFVGLVPDFTLKNYIDVLSSATTLKLYYSTVKFTLIVLAITSALGFWISYFLVFHIRSTLLSIGLFLVCTIPFWTSTIIRMISWRPVLGKEGLINLGLVNLGVLPQPLNWLLYSDFAVVVAYVHLFSLFMIVPIFNSMARIDKSLLEAAVDAGATRWGVVWNVVVPLSKTGLALGALFVMTLVMGDFFVVTVMSGGLSGSATSGIFADLQLLNYPRAAANAVVLLITVLLLASAIFRVVDVRKELVR